MKRPGGERDMRSPLFLFISVEKTPIFASSESGLRMSDLPCQTLRENRLIENFVQKNNLSP